MHEIAKPDVTCFNQSCFKQRKNRCLEAGTLGKQADLILHPHTKDDSTAQVVVQSKASLAKTIENFQLEVTEECTEQDEALRLMIEYATNIMSQMAE